MTMLKIVRLGMLACAALAASGASAQEGAFMKDVLGTMGLIEKDKPYIDYKERAPLVVPPKLDLRPPVDGASIEARNPQWPRDPDVLAARQRDAEARKPITQDERRRFNADSGGTLTVDEIRAGRRPGAGIPDKPEYRYGDSSPFEYRMTPEQMTAGRKQERQLAGVEAERQSLTDPPAGFRKPTGKTKSDFEPVTRPDEANAMDYLRKQRGTN